MLIIHVPRHEKICLRFDSNRHEELHNVLNPYVTNGISHPYQLGDFIFNFRGIRSYFSFLFHCSMKIMYNSKQNSPRWYAAYCGVASGVFCLPMSHKKVRRIWIKMLFFNCYKYCLYKTGRGADQTAQMHWMHVTFLPFPLRSHSRQI